MAYILKSLIPKFERYEKDGKTDYEVIPCQRVDIDNIFQLRTGSKAY